LHSLGGVGVVAAHVFQRRVRALRRRHQVDPPPPLFFNVHIFLSSLLSFGLSCWFCVPLLCFYFLSDKCVCAACVPTTLHHVCLGSCSVPATLHHVCLGRVLYPPLATCPPHFSVRVRVVFSAKQALFQCYLRALNDPNLSVYLLQCVVEEQP
jgi:hypothetical protein